MSSSSIRSSIRHYESLIAQEQDEIYRQEDKLYELQVLRSTFVSKQSEFMSIQEQRKSFLGGILGKVSTVRIAQQFYNGMLTLLSGDEHSKTASEFNSCISKVDKAIQACNDKIDRARDRIRSYRNTIDSLEAQLRAALQAEAEAAAAAAAAAAQQ